MFESLILCILIRLKKIYKKIKINFSFIFKFIRLLCVVVNDMNISNNE